MANVAGEEHALNPQIAPPQAPRRRLAAIAPLPLAGPHSCRRACHAEAMFRFDPRPLKWFVLIFGIEVVIALFVRDTIIRPYGGDVLAVMWVYTGFRVVRRFDARVLAAASFGVGALVEVAQLLQLSVRMGLSDSPVATTVLGSVFEWGDLVAYGVGALIAWFIDTRTTLLSTPRPASASE